ncbi:MAG: leucine-rich repeat domain-containing protein [Clostridia bacterium]|nr:leucine-rich repeat domain-containing protein [Clostridia bacterium]
MKKEVEIGELTFKKHGDYYSVIGCDKQATKVEIPNTIGDCIVSEIESEAFANCTNLVSVKLSDYIMSIGFGAFRNCASLTKITGKNVKYLGGFAFVNCKKLSSVPLFDNIEEGSFSYCQSLTRLPITDETDKLPDSVFEHCDSLVDITIPKGVRSIDALAFRSCHGLKRMSFAISDGWWCKSRYHFDDSEIDVSDPIEMAVYFSRMDFDDGPAEIYRKR